MGGGQVRERKKRIRGMKTVRLQGERGGGRHGTERFLPRYGHSVRKATGEL